jgi:predicted O-methyltransferase YrrM
LIEATGMSIGFPPYPFDRAWSFAAQVTGWLTRDEAELLYRLSTAASRLGRVVELGSYCGRSTIMLAAGLAEASSEPLVCVDTFRGSAENQPGKRHFRPETLVDGIVNTYPAFIRNLQHAGLLERIAVMRLSTREAAAQFSGAIGLLFVDADHDYAAVSADLRAWSPPIVADGWVVLHDVGAWSGPTHAAADLLDAGFQRYAQSDTALALRNPTVKR